MGEVIQTDWPFLLVYFSHSSHSRDHRLRPAWRACSRGTRLWRGKVTCCFDALGTQGIACHAQDCRLRWLCGTSWQACFTSAVGRNELYFLLFITDFVCHLFSTPLKTKLIPLLGDMFHSLPNDYSNRFFEEHLHGQAWPWHSMHSLPSVWLRNAKTNFWCPAAWTSAVWE